VAERLLTPDVLMPPGPDRSTADTPASCVGSDAPRGVEIDRERGDAPTLLADLDLLHATLNHYSRLLLDVQQQRVAQGNRVEAMRREGLDDAWIAPALDALEHLAKLERSINAYLGKQAERHFMAAWVKAQRGIGLPGFARLIGITGSLDRFANVAKLWAYLGMHTVDGKSPRRQKGVRANWSPAGRVLCRQIAESVVKMGKGGPYRTAYDTKKAEYESGRPDWTQAHRHEAAMRYAVKELLKAMWLEWRRARRAMQEGGC
jgi:hypothetical protein